MSHKSMFLVSVAAAICSTPVRSQSTDTPPSGTAETSTQSSIGEIIVTAQKRTERLQDVPNSIVALPAEKLDNQGVTQIRDLVKLVPGLQLIGGAAPGVGKPVLRGVSSGGDRSSLVGLYLDDVPFTPSSVRVQTANLSFDPSLADIERIEVLKGPQSTLYGASTMGGLIKFITKRPNVNDFRGTVRLTGTQIAHGELGFDSRLSINVPIFDGKAAFAGSAFYRRDGGYVDDPFLGREDVNDVTARGVRGSLLINLTENLETIFSGFVQKTKFKENFEVVLDPMTLRPIGGKLEQVSTPVRPAQEFEYKNATNTTSLTLPFATLTNTLSYVEFVSNEVFDFSSLSGAIGAPESFVTTFRTRRSERFSDELRLASNPGRLEWMLGVWYTDEDIKFPETFRGTDANGQIVSEASPIFNVRTATKQSGTFREKAVFGNLTYHFTDRLEATAGARYSANKQDFVFVSNGLLGVNNNGHEAKDSSMDYLATVSFKPTKDLTFYLRAASAYRPGGPNNLTAAQQAANLPRSFKSDKLWNYEAGIKGVAFDKLLSFSAVAFHMVWSDIQVNIITVVNGTPFSTTGNGAKAESDGVELEVALAPADGLTFNLGAAYTNAKIKSDAPTIGAVSGDRLPFSPKLSATANVDYRKDISAGVTAYVGATLAHVGKLWTGFSNSGRFELPSYETIDLRGGFEWSRHSVNFVVENLTDSRALTSAFRSSNKGSPLVGQVLRPRRLLLTLETKF